MELVLCIRFEDQFKKMKGDKKKEEKIWEENCIKHLMHTYLLYTYSLFNFDKTLSNRCFYTH